MNLEKLKETARRFEQKEEWRKAIEVYLKAIQEVESGRDQHPDLAVYNRVGDLYVRLNDTNAAIRAYERAADLYGEQGFFNNAIALCGKILRINPARNQVYLKLAYLHARKNVSIEAKRNLLAYIERMHAAGQLDEALASVKEYVEEFAANQELRLMLVDLLRAASRENEAREELAKVAGTLEAKGNASGVAAGGGLVHLDVDFTQPLPDLSSTTARPSLEETKATPAALRPKSNDLIFLDTGLDVPSPARGADMIITSDAVPVDVPGPPPTIPAAPPPPAMPKAGQAQLAGEFAGMEVPLIETGELAAAVPEEAAAPAAAEGGALEGLERNTSVAPGEDAPSLLEGLEGSQAEGADSAVAGEHEPLALEATALGDPNATIETPVLDGFETTGLDADALDSVEPLDGLGVDLELIEIVDVAPDAVEAAASGTIDEEVAAELEPVFIDLGTPAAAEAEPEATEPPPLEAAAEEPVEEPVDQSPALELIEVPAEPEESFAPTPEALPEPEPEPEVVEATAEIIELEVVQAAEPEAEALAEAPPPAEGAVEPEFGEPAPDNAPAPVLEFIVPAEIDVDAFAVDADAEMPGTPVEPVAADDEARSEAPAAEPQEPAAEPVFAEASAAPESSVPDAVEEDPEAQWLVPAEAAVVGEEAVAAAPSLEFEPPPPEPLGQVPPPATVSTLVEELEDKILDDPDDATLHQRLAEALLESGDGQRAVEEYAIALSRYEAVESWEWAAYVADRLVELRPEVIRYYQKRVELAFRRQDRARLVEAYLALGDALVRADAMEKAIAVYQRVLDHDPANELARRAIATYAPPPVVPPPAAAPVAVAPPAVAPPPAAAAPPPAAPAAPAPAAPAAAGFVDLNSLVQEEAVPARDTRMRVEQGAPTGDEQRDFEDMLAAFKKGIEQNLEAEDYEAHYDLGVAFKEMGLLDEAIGEFQKALRSPDGRLRTSEALAMAFYEKGQVAVAEAVLRRAVDGIAGPEDDKLGLLYWLGRVLEEQARADESLTYYERALAIDIRFMDVQDRIHRLTAGRQG